MIVKRQLLLHRANGAQYFRRKINGRKKNTSIKKKKKKAHQSE